MRTGIISFGNWIVDTVKFIDVYPQRGNLTTIHKEMRGLGGCAHNVLVDLARMRTGIPLYGGGCIGDDFGGRLCLQACRDNGIDSSNIHVIQGESTSYTDVMSEVSGAASRTFFHNRGANARLTADMIESACSNARIFHLGYLLLLDELDKSDEKYGIVAARVLETMQKKGYKTSVDVVSEEGNRFQRVVLPCLKYVDYFIINEVEAGACLDMDLHDNTGVTDVEKAIRAAQLLLDKGVREIVVIHFPEGGIAVSKDEACFVKSDLIPAANIVSSVGAGDAFCAGVLYSIHENYSFGRMLSFANACARFNLRNETSTGGAPTLKEINEFLNVTER